MRESYRTYESVPEVLAQAITIGWTQSVVILEAELSLQDRTWYIQAVRRFGWSKLELQRKIDSNVHLDNALDFADKVCYTEEKNSSMEDTANDKNPVRLPRQYTSCP